MVKSEMETLTAQIQSLEQSFDGSFADTLLSLSHKYLDQYYLQIRQQASRGFTITVLFAVLGGLVTLGGVACILFFSHTDAYMVTAAGLVTDLIAAIAFYLYQKPIREMHDYYDRLVLAQNLAIAIKGAASLPEPRDAEQMAKIVDKLMEHYNDHLFRPASDPEPQTPGGGQQGERPAGM